MLGIESARCLQAGRGSGLRVEIDNPAGVVIPAFLAEINQDDWLPDMTAEEEGESAPQQHTGPSIISENCLTCLNEVNCRFCTLYCNYHISTLWEEGLSTKPPSILQQAFSYDVESSHTISLL